MNTKNVAIYVFALLLSLAAAGYALALDFTVINVDDSGDGSLRWAINQANSNTGADRILFDIPAGLCDPFYSYCTISPLTTLPVLTDDGTTIDGYSQSGAAKATESSPPILMIQLNGSLATNTNGLNIGSADNIIQGLIINRFDFNGIAIGTSGATGNVIKGNFIGTNFDGTASQGNGYDGIFIGDQASNNTVGDCSQFPIAPYLYTNVLSGNGWDGVGIHGNGTNENCVGNNLVGTDVTGMELLGNTLHGVYIYGGAQQNEVAENKIGGNMQDGIRLLGVDTANNYLQENLIGVNVGGTPPESVDVGNLGNGIYCADGTRENTINGNYIGFNNGNGIELSGVGTDNNLLAGNHIGTFYDPLDRFAPEELLIGNDRDGVYIHLGAIDNKVGVCIDGECIGNYIGDNRYGVLISGGTTTQNTLHGNHIGIDYHGMSAIPNSEAGVSLSDGANGNFIGGTIIEGMKNIISGNSGDGIFFFDGDDNYIMGNYIGANKDGDAVVANGGNGIHLVFGSSENRIMDGNVIVGSAENGIRLAESSNKNVISANYIGTNVSGAALGNTSSGVLIDGTSFAITDNIIGDENTITNNASGIVIDGSMANKNSIKQKSIYNNKGMGIDLRNGANGMIAAPTISTNGLEPLNVSGSACAGCIVEIFSNPTNDGEGRHFLGASLADGTGDFIVTISSLPYRFITATATDMANGSSEFSPVYNAKMPFCWQLFLPALMNTRR